MTQQKHNHFHSITDKIELGLVGLNNSLAVTFWNTWMEKHSQKSKQEVLGKPLLEIFPEIDNSLTLQRIEESIQKNYPSVLSNAFNKTPFKLWSRRHKPELLQQKVEIIPVIDNPDLNCLIQITDVSSSVKREEALELQVIERKNAEDHIIKSEYRFRTIFQKAPLGIALINTNTGKILNANQKYSEILGTAYANPVGHDWLATANPADTKETMKLLHLLKEGKIPEFKIPRREVQADGKTVWVNMSVVPIDIDKRGDPHHLCMIENITEKKKNEELNWRRANFDFLTGLPNRNLFKEKLNELEKASRRFNQEFALFFIDVDKFKEINDSFGHDRGDELLVHVAKRLQSCVRESDTVARLGGDEFVILLPNISDHTGVEKVAKNVLSQFSHPFFLQGDAINISTSIGITIYPDDSSNITELLKAADHAMYAAKSKGRNCFHFFTQDMYHNILKKRTITKELRTALSKKQFEIHYQPIVDLHSNLILKAEALLRWNHSAKGLLYPDYFIPIAEESGLILDISDWLFKSVTRQASEWKKNIHPDFQLSINTSPIQYQSRKGLNWLRYLENSGLDGSAIFLEITENILTDANEEVIQTLQEYKQRGISIALDDFGTGYSSLSFLRRFDIDYLKIDESFLKNISNNPDDRALCDNIIQMAHHLHLKVVAEGIEHTDQKIILSQAGCDYAQGFLFAPPLSAEDFEKFVLSHNGMLKSGSLKPDSSFKMSDSPGGQAH